jgi:hypothetical protein
MNSCGRQVDVTQRFASNIQQLGLNSTSNFVYFNHFFTFCRGSNEDVGEVWCGDDLRVVEEWGAGEGVSM